MAGKFPYFYRLRDEGLTGAAAWLKRDWEKTVSDYQRCIAWLKRIREKYRE